MRQTSMPRTVAVIQRAYEAAGVWPHHFKGYIQQFIR